MTVHALGCKAQHHASMEQMMRGGGGSGSAVERQTQQTGQELLEQAPAAQRERAAAPGESMLGE
jgi:hypothetical protein